MNYFINYDWNRLSNPNHKNLCNPEEGFIKGNMFQNLYDSYKNYQPIPLKANTEQEKKCNELSAVCFAAHELNLYLDLHPEDQSMFLLFQDYQRKANRLMEEYEKQYGPLNVSSEEMNQSFTWQSDKWPWEVNNVSLS